MDVPAAKQRSPATVPATIALNAAGPISGTIAGKGGDPRPFFGWLELMDALEELRRAAVEAPAARAAD